MPTVQSTLVLLLGVYVFLPLTPAITGTMGITEPLTAGRMGIGGWMPPFDVLGYSVTRVLNEAQR